MPTFTNDLTLAHAADRIFAYLCVPSNRLKMTPPAWPVEQVEGPPRLEAGSQTTWKLRRFGVTQLLTLEVTVCEPPHRLVEEQRRGPFRRWVHEVTVASESTETRLRDVIAFEPPSGMLGLILTTARIQEMLTESFAWRDRQLRAELSETAERQRE